MDTNELSGDSAPLRGIRILIIDDDRVNATQAKGLLEGLGATVQTALDPVKALAIYGDEKAAIDLVMVDYFMPLLNGGETIQHLQKLNPDVKILLCSCSEGIRSRQVVQQYSINGYLHKPLRSGETLWMIRQIFPATSTTEQVAEV